MHKTKGRSSPGCGNKPKRSVGVKQEKDVGVTPCRGPKN